MTSDKRETKTPVYHHGTTVVEKIRDDEYLIAHPDGTFRICASQEDANKAVKRYWRNHYRHGFLCTGRAVWRDLSKMVQ